LGDSTEDMSDNVQQEQSVSTDVQGCWGKSVTV
jgi:hypothetical protein